MAERERDPALVRLDALIGEWGLEAGPPGEPPWPGEARATFEWMKGQMFLVEHWTISIPEFPDGVAIIGPAEEPGTLRQYYFDSRGVRRVYEMTLDDGVWKLWRDSTDPFPQRFVGTFEDDGQTISGHWEKALDGSNWEVDFDLTYRKQS
jgi:hypothetical protein